MKMRIAVIGCGGISDQYGNHIFRYPELLEIAGATDLDFSRAEEFTKKYGGKVFKDFDAVLADPDVDTILNLTVHRIHFDLNKRALKAGKHVYSEKPMALTYAEANELCELSRETGCRMAAAPSTYLGEGVQTTAKFLEQKQDLLGAMRLVYAEVNWGQINRWIPAPQSYFTVGPLLDVGVYAITALTFLLGPVRKVWGYSAILQKDRVGTDGQPFPVTAPDFTTGVMEFENGVVARLTTNYYVPTSHMPHLLGFEFHGDQGSFRVSDYHGFNAKCQYLPYQQREVQVPLLRENLHGMDRAVGLVDLAVAIQENRPHRASAEHAAHVVEIMEGLQRSFENSERIAIESCFERPPLMDWAKQAELVVGEAPSV